MGAQVRIHLTGGAGHIGPPTAAVLMAAGHDVVQLDNFCNCQPDVLDRVDQIAGRRPPLVRVLDLRDGMLWVHLRGGGTSVQLPCANSAAMPMDSDGDQALLHLDGVARLDQQLGHCHFKSGGAKRTWTRLEQPFTAPCFLPYRLPRLRCLVFLHAHHKTIPQEHVLQPPWVC